MEIEKINQETIIKEIPNNHYLKPQIKWMPKGNWTYIFVPNDFEILVKNTKANRQYLANLLQVMKKEIMLKRQGIKKVIERDIKIWFNKNIPLSIN